MLLLGRPTNITVILLELPNLNCHILSHWATFMYVAFYFILYFIFIICNPAARLQNTINQCDEFLVILFYFILFLCLCFLSDSVHCFSDTLLNTYWLAYLRYVKQSSTLMSFTRQIKLFDFTIIEKTFDDHTPTFVYRRLKMMVVRLFAKSAMLLTSL